MGGVSGGGVLGMGPLGRGPDAGCHYQDPLDDVTWLESHGPEQANGLPYHKHGGTNAPANIRARTSSCTGRGLGGKFGRVLPQELGISLD